MTEQQLTDIIHVLCSCPDHEHSQIDQDIKTKLMDLLKIDPKDRRQAMKSILDDCTHYSLASDFAMSVLHMLLGKFE